MTTKATFISPLLSTLLLLGFHSTAVNAASSESYVKSDSGCQVYKPSISFGNRVEWHGQCPNSYAQGKGVAEWYNGKQLASRYQGTFTQGKLEGIGRIDWKLETNCDFDYYQGELKDSHPMGKGIMNFTDGNRYDGLYVPAGQLAKAVFTWGAGNEYYSDRYEGTFLNGQKHGHGTYTWGEQSAWAGDVYEGEYKNNKQHGYGVYTEGNGSRYKGNWEKGRKSGYGEMAESDGTIYKGEWKNDLRDGYGKITWSDGMSYEGQMLNNQFHGNGKMIYTNGVVYEGEWANGKSHGQGKRAFDDGGYVEGEYREGQPYEATAVRANGIRYAGSFQDGKAWGFGHLTAPRTAYDDDKRAVNGVWQGDTFVEKGWFYDNKFKFPCDSTEDCQQVAAKDVTKQAYMAHSDNSAE